MQLSLEFVPKGPIDNDTVFIWIVAWHRTGNKPLSEQVIMVKFTDADMNFLDLIS